MPSNYIVARLSYCRNAWVVKYGYSSHQNPYWRVRAAQQMLDRNGMRGVDEYVTWFCADESYEQQVHRSLARNRLSHVVNDDGGYSRETYSLCHTGLEQFLHQRGLRVPAAASSAVREAQQAAERAQALEHQRVAAQRLARKQGRQKFWSGVWRRMRSFHERMSRHPRTWLRLPTHHPSAEATFVRIMSRYVGLTCQCGTELWFDLSLNHDTSATCARCFTRHNRPWIPERLLTAA